MIIIPLTEETAKIYVGTILYVCFLVAVFFITLFACGTKTEEVAYVTDHNQFQLEIIKQKHNCQSIKLIDKSVYACFTPNKIIKIKMY